MKAIVTEDPAEFAKYGIDAPAAEVTLVSGSAKAVVAFGTQDRGQLHSRARSVEVAWSSPRRPILFDEIEKGPAEYRRKDVFEFRAFNLDRLEITRGAATVVFERLKGKGKDGADAWQNAATKKAVDTAKFEAFLTQAVGHARAVVCRRQDQDGPRCTRRHG